MTVLQNTTKDHSQVAAVTVAVRGQNEKKMPTSLWPIAAAMVIGAPVRPSLNGPQRISCVGVARRLSSNTDVEMANEE